jgi:hypothetical protein
VSTTREQFPLSVAVSYLMKCYESPELSGRFGRTLGAGSREGALHTESRRDKAAVARRKLADAEHRLLLANEEVEKLRERLAQAQREADRLHALEDRIAAAQTRATCSRPESEESPSRLTGAPGEDW